MRALLFFILAILAEVLGTIGGFGSSVFFVPIAGFFFDFQSVLGLTALFHLGSNLSKVAQFRNGINLRLVLYLGIPSVILVILGAQASDRFSGVTLQWILGIFLVLFSAFFIAFRRMEIKPTPARAIIGGGISGFLAGILGTGGAIRGLTMAAFNLPKDIFIATSALIDLAVDLSRTAVYYDMGYIHAHDLIYVPFLIAIGWFGTRLGKTILSQVPQERFRLISLMLVLLIGLVTLIYSFSEFSSK